MLVNPDHCLLHRGLLENRLGTQTEQGRKHAAVLHHTGRLVEASARQNIVPVRKEREEGFGDFFGWACETEWSAFSLAFHLA